MSLPAEITLPLVQNQDFSWTYGISLADAVNFPPQLAASTAYPLAGATVKATIRQNSDTNSPVLLDFHAGVTLVGVGTLGTNPAIPCFLVTIALTNSQTASLSPGTLYFDIELTLAGVQTYLFYGPCTVQGTGTR